MTSIVHAQIDMEGRLIAADPPLDAIQMAAGGAMGDSVAIPQIASLARLAKTLAIPVSRPLIIADQGQVYDLHAKAQLREGIIHLILTGWDNIRLPQSESVDTESRDFDFARLENDLAWETDADFNLRRLSSGVSAAALHGLATYQGQAFGAVFRLKADKNGALPILVGLAQRDAFQGQYAKIALSSKEAPEDIDVLINGEPIFYGNGQFAGLRGSAQRTSEAQPRDDSLPNEDGFAERLDTALRAPLGRIVNNADAIAQLQDGPVRHDYVGYSNDIATAGRHLLGMVDDLVDLQAIERPDFTIDTEALDLADVARRASGLLAVRAADRQVRIDRPDEDEELMAMADFRRVLQILVNLIGNAVRYSPTDSVVWIRTEEEGDITAIIVADQGQGIPFDDQDRIFEKFERLDPSEPGGSGLGLYISRRLARAMGGDITVDSAPGMGARFVLTLPRAPELKLPI
jgi:signal transduction histidine kinase